MTEKKKKETVKGEIKAVHFSNNGWSAGRIKPKGGALLSFSGSCSISVGDMVTLTGEYFNDPKYGRQFKVSNFEFLMETSNDGIAAFIAKNPTIKGIGPKRAALLAGKFGGEKWEDNLENNREEMASCAKVPIEVIENIFDEWSRTSSFNQAAVWLAQFGLNFGQINKLTAKYGNSCIDILSKNPYQIIGEIPRLGFKRVDEIALKMGIEKDFQRRIDAGILFTIDDECAKHGHTAVKRAELISKANVLLAIDTLSALEMITDALDNLISSGEIASDKVGAFDYISTTDSRNREKLILEFLKTANDKPTNAFRDFDFSKFEENKDLNDCQKRAVNLAKNKNAFVITGGAGTGKTYTLNEICRVFDHARKSITLCAPTGKAAKRMEQSTGRDAYTIHRLLGYDGSGFSESTVDSDLIIIDEFSMVDVNLFFEFVSRIDISKSVLIIVGDHNQLPPVGPGNMLRDIIEFEIVPVIKLSTVMRQAGVLKRNSTQILKGVVEPTSERESESTLPDWYKINAVKTADDVIDYVKAMYMDFLNDVYGYNLISDVQLLSPQRTGPLGVNAFNKILQSILQWKFFKISVEQTPDNRRPNFYIADKIIQRRNNYKLGIMNGTIGQIISIEANGNMICKFENVVETVELSKKDGDIRDIDLAYALTIHQVQGSEFPVSIVICHKQHNFMNHKNLLYTAVTRSKDKCVILGDAWMMRECAKRAVVSNRQTWISLWLNEARLIDSLKTGLKTNKKEIGKLPVDDIPF